MKEGGSAGRKPSRGSDGEGPWWGEGWVWGGGCEGWFEAAG